MIIPIMQYHPDLGIGVAFKAEFIEWQAIEVRGGMITTQVTLNILN